MAVMYLAKVNVNAKIFEVYESTLKIPVILSEVYQKLDTSKVYTEEKREEYVDELGNKAFYMRKSKYQFAELERTEGSGVITGKIVRNFNRPTEQLDRKTNEVTDTYTDECVSIYFYFDVMRELITFCSRQSFGYNQFTNAFNNLLNLTISGYGFEVFLQKDENLLDEKLKEFKRISKVTAILIPPNSNEEDLRDLRDTLGYIGDCQDSNASKYKIELTDSDENPGIRMQAKIMKDTIKAITRGYGDLTAQGYNGSDRKYVMKSNKDAALTCIIDEKLEQEDYKDESKGFIERFLANLINKNNKGA
ncbi:hypothetical protein FDB29_08940 [Clostridium botulinum]|nr:hypothetical protein [Clostridium botulinum]